MKRLDNEQREYIQRVVDKLLIKKSENKDTITGLDGFKWPIDRTAKFLQEILFNDRYLIEPKPNFIRSDQEILNELKKII